jgi:hypothetical protein
MKMMNVHTKLAKISPKIFGPCIIRLKGIKTCHHLSPFHFLKKFNGFPRINGHEHHYVQEKSNIACFTSIYFIFSVDRKHQAFNTCKGKLAHGLGSTKS